MQRQKMVSDEMMSEGKFWSLDVIEMRLVFG